MEKNSITVKDIPKKPVKKTRKKNRNEKKTNRNRNTRAYKINSIHQTMFFSPVLFSLIQRIFFLLFVLVWERWKRNLHLMFVWLVWERKKNDIIFAIYTETKMKKKKTVTLSHTQKHREKVLSLDFIVIECCFVCVYGIYLDLEENIYWIQRIPYHWIHIINDDDDKRAQRTKVQRYNFRFFLFERKGMEKQTKKNQEILNGNACVCLFEPKKKT